MKPILYSTVKYVFKDLTDFAHSCLLVFLDGVLATAALFVVYFIFFSLQIFCVVLFLNFDGYFVFLIMWHTLFLIPNFFSADDYYHTIFTVVYVHKCKTLNSVYLMSQALEVAPYRMHLFAASCHMVISTHLISMNIVCQLCVKNLNLMALGGL